MSDIAAFLAARIADDEAIVRGAATHQEPGRDLWITEWPHARSLGVSQARMRVEIEAKRRLVVLARDRGDEDVLRLLAMVYDDHPDWQPEWTVLSTADDSPVSARTERKS